MTKLSIIFGFRNKEIGRVESSIRSIAKQSFSDYEVLFIDYGSKPEVSKALMKMLESYPFVKYVYNNTAGMPWNRAHALNTGIRLAEGEYIFTSDIDLIFSENFFKTILEKGGPDKVVYSNVYLMKEGQDYREGQMLACKEHTGGSGIGLFPILKLKEVGSYDEFYKIWGCEDRDLKTRLAKLNVKQEVMPIKDAPVYHQWHPQTNMQRGFMPAGWWEEMNQYYFQHKNNPIRKADFGKLFGQEDRPSLKAVSQSVGKNSLDASDYSNIIALFEKWTGIFDSLRSGEDVKLVYKIEDKKFKLQDTFARGLFFKMINGITGLKNKRYRVMDVEAVADQVHNLNSVNLFDIEKLELKSFFWTFLRNREAEIADYYSEENDTGGMFIVIKK